MRLPVAVLASLSRLSVCMIPVPGGYTLKPLSVFVAHIMKR